MLKEKRQPWNKGLPVRLNPGGEFKEGQPKPLKAFSFPVGHQVNRGRTPWNKGTRGVVKAWNKGVSPSEETRKKLVESHRGKVGRMSSNWKGGVTPINQIIRHSFQYKLWRKAVFERDNYTCVWCGIRGAKLNADHVKQFAFYPELRLELSNGRTLCEDCHKKTPTYKRQVKIDDAAIDASIALATGQSLIVQYLR